MKAHLQLIGLVNLDHNAPTQANSAVLPLIEGKLLGKHLSTTRVRHELIGNLRVDQSGHVWYEFPAIVHKPQKGFQFRRVLWRWNFLSGLHLARRGMDSMSVQHEREML